MASFGLDPSFPPTNRPRVRNIKPSGPPRDTGGGVVTGDIINQDAVDDAAKPTASVPALGKVLLGGAALALVWKIFG